MARSILIGKRGGPLTNSIHAASLRLEELKFGDRAGTQNHALRDSSEWIGQAVAECDPAAPFTTDDVFEAASRYGFNNAVSYARANVDPLLGVSSSWLDGFLHGAGAYGRLQPQGEEMLGRWRKGYE